MFRLLSCQVRRSLSLLERVFSHPSVPPTNRRLQGWLVSYTLVTGVAGGLSIWGLRGAGPTIVGDASKKNAPHTAWFRRIAALSLAAPCLFALARSQNFFASSDAAAQPRSRLRSLVGQCQICQIRQCCQIGTGSDGTGLPMELEVSRACAIGAARLLSEQHPFMRRGKLTRLRSRPRRPTCCCARLKSRS